MNSLKKAKQSSAIDIKEMDGRSYAQDALLNPSDRMKLFVDRGSAVQFGREFSAQ